MTDERRFPSDFLWGAATSAYQIEGQPLADGAGPSIWHRFSRNHGRIAGGDTGDIACDHFHRYPDDIALMHGLGLGAYRLSIAWGRIFPSGRGAINQPGLDFYRRLVDALSEHGIRPMITLYHWDLPAALQDLGGWLNPDCPKWLAEYAVTVFRALDDAVPLWVTINEPWVATVLGHLEGAHAPGHRDRFEAPRVAHHMLRAHALAVQAYRGEGAGQIGLAVNLEPQYPATESPEDAEAARRRDAFINRWMLDPLFLGRYPSELAEIFTDAWPDFSDRELEELREPGDFVGVNYYSRGLAKADQSARPLGAVRVPHPHALSTTMGWEVYPDGLTETLVSLKERYGGPALYITENGAAFEDPPSRDGCIDDPLRMDYLRAHLRAAYAALEQGVDLRGYFVWSLLDNFEWAEGYAQRFGLFHVDREHLARTPKASAELYREIIASNGATVL